jgi:hypothetical protein
LVQVVNSSITGVRGTWDRRSHAKFSTWESDRPSKVNDLRRRPCSNPQVNSMCLCVLIVSPKRLRG